MLGVSEAVVSAFPAWPNSALKSQRAGRARRPVLTGPCAERPARGEACGDRALRPPPAGPRRRPRLPRRPGRTCLRCPPAGRRARGPLGRAAAARVLAASAAGTLPPSTRLPSEAAGAELHKGNCWGERELTRCPSPLQMAEATARNPSSDRISSQVIDRRQRLSVRLRCRGAGAGEGRPLCFLRAYQTGVRVALAHLNRFK